jgi:hypothetical protein
VGMKNWRYFLEKSTNLEKFPSLELFDDSSAITLQEVGLNQKFVVDF